MAIIGRDKADFGLIVAHAQDEGYEYPLVHAKLEFSDDKDDFMPVVTFCPIIDAEKDEESQRRIADKLKSLILDSLTELKVRVRWDPDGELAELMRFPDGKRRLVPLSKIEEIKNKPKIIAP